MLRNNSHNGTSNAHQACAACKHQRKKCPSDCILAPYFPADKTRDFQGVHKVFGVANVGRILRSVKEEDRKYVAQSLIWEAYCRQKDPVLGPYGEYKKLFDELKLYKSQSQNQNQLVQLPGQGGMVYKQMGDLINGWNGSNGVNNNKQIGNGGVANSNYSHDNENSSTDLSPYGYSQYYMQCQEKLKQERDLCSVIVQSQPEQHQQQFQRSINGYNKQYYLPGQYNSVNGKTMESTLWDDGVHFI